jgi:hypothetical protein
VINNAATVVPGSTGTPAAQTAADADKTGAPDYTKSIAPGSFSDFKLNMDA